MSDAPTERKSRHNFASGTSVDLGQPVHRLVRCEGEERIVEAGGIRIAVRFVGRKGRRGIALRLQRQRVRPSGSLDLNETVRSPDRFI